MTKINISIERRAGAHSPGNTIMNCYECDYENWNKCTLAGRCVESLDVPAWCPRKHSRTKSLVQAYKKMDKSRKIELIAGAIFWAISWALVGMIFANALIGKVWR